MKFQLKYNDKIYIVEDELATTDPDSECEIPFIWEDGNYSCDCNRSLFIQRCCDETFPDFKCGDEIELIGIVK
jgi:hypothetical protein